MHRMLASAARFIGNARMRGRLYDLGNYPGFVPSDANHAWVHGEVYDLENAGELLARLDEYEGCGPNDALPHEYVREQREVVMESGDVATAWTYVFIGSVAGRSEVASGDYYRRATIPDAG
ncbi:MAG: gamma-glutamylcyclotransferase [Gammaproteobacteria bacterium]|nr:gamma-glutamylcyclotransferase [Gammaproteobacteria bacterium]